MIKRRSLIGFLPARRPAWSRPRSQRGSRVVLDRATMSKGTIPRAALIHSAVERGLVRRSNFKIRCVAAHLPCATSDGVHHMQSGGAISELG
jgi:hypothetical protein